MKHIKLKLSVVVVFLIFASQSMAWHDKTHLAVSKAAGLASWYNTAGPDMAKIKAGHVESYNHYFNNNAEAEITVFMVMNQIDRYNQRNRLLDAEGHLLGAIIASLRAYEKDVRRGKYAEYHLDYCAHYIADLSQPLHNIPYDDFNKSFHEATDGLVENTVLNEPQNITRHMYTITLRSDHFEEALAGEIARIANLTRKLGYKIRAENRGLTPEEAYIQLGHSASLLRAVVKRYSDPEKKQEEQTPAAPGGR